MVTVAEVEKLAGATAPAASSGKPICYIAFFIPF